MFEAPYEFYLEFSEIAKQESEHFSLLYERIQEIGCSFPSLPCNDALYQFSKATRHDICSRIVLTSLYSEGRALDSHDRLIHKLKSANGDKVSAKLLGKIINEEVGHVRNGLK